MIVGNRIYLRTLQVSDSQKMVESSEHEEIRFMTNTKESFTLDVIEKHIENIRQDESRQDFAICLSDNDEMIGELSILDIDLDNSCAGYRIAMSDLKYTNQGFGTEATLLAVDYAFDVLNLNRLQLEVYSINPRGIRAYEKAGFIKEGILREALLTKDGYADEIIMSIIRSDREGV